jgi:hypothetical protein
VTADCSVRELALCCVPARPASVDTRSYATSLSRLCMFTQSSKFLSMFSMARAVYCKEERNDLGWVGDFFVVCGNSLLRLYTFS